MENKIFTDFKKGLFHIDPVYGFVLGDPLEVLPTYFETWNELARNMPDLAETKQLRNKVNKMAMLDISKLNGVKEKCLAHLQLSVIAAGYVWQEGEQGVVKSIPKQLAVPWYKLSEELNLKAILCYANIILYNWRKKDESKPLELDNLRCLYNVTKGENAEWFITVTLQIEFEFAAAIHLFLEGIEAVTNSDSTKLIRCLRDINGIIGEMLKVFRRIHEKLTSDVFALKMRPFLNGWGSEGNCLPDGLIYEGIDGKPKRMVGGSAAQSSLLQTLDAFLGVKHNKDKQKFLDEMKEYMPKPHRDFIEAIESTSKVRDYVSQTNNETLTESFNACVENMEKFRSYHMTVVTKYVVNAYGKAEESSSKLSKRGTGGSLGSLEEAEHQGTRKKMTDNCRRGTV